MDTQEVSPDVVVCLLPKKLKHLGICMEMGEHAMNILEQYPNIKIIRDDIVFISNKIESHIAHNSAEVIMHVEQNNYVHILVLVPCLAKRAPSRSLYGEIISKLKERNCYVTEIECAI